MNFSQRLKELRAEKGLTQDQLSAQTGLSHGCIAMLEVDKRAPTGNTLALLADFFECSTDYLLGRSDELGIISIRSQTKTPAETLTTDEKKLLEVYRKLDVKNKIHVSTYAEIRLEEQSDSKRRA